MLQKFVRTDTEMHMNFIKMGERLREELNLLLGDNGVLIYPSHSTPAPFHGQEIVKTFNFAYTATFNILGNPVTQVPLGLGSSGVPLGVQLVAGLNMDRLCAGGCRAQYGQAVCRWLQGSIWIGCLFMWQRGSL